MSIAIVNPLPTGNAIRIFLTPPTGAQYWRVLKMGSDGFGGPDDLDYALIAYEGTERVFVDSESLQNEVMAFYKPFYRMADDTWQEGATAHGTPAATFADQATDVQSFLRKRLEEGLLIEVQRENIMAELGYVQVYTAPPALEQNLRFPLVTITLDGESPAERAIGEDVGGDLYLEDIDNWFESEGWLAQVQLSIVAWSLNSDERIELRKAIRRIIVANLPVFDSLGMTQVQVSFQDVDALNGEYNVNIYQVVASFSCLAPVRVGHSVDPISDITVRSNYG